MPASGQGGSPRGRHSGRLPLRINKDSPGSLSNGALHFQTLSNLIEPVPILQPLRSKGVIRNPRCRGRSSQVERAPNASNVLLLCLTCVCVGSRSGLPPKRTYASTTSRQDADIHPVTVG